MSRPEFIEVNCECQCGQPLEATLSHSMRGLKITLEPCTSEGCWERHPKTQDLIREYDELDDRVAELEAGKA